MEQQVAQAEEKLSRLQKRAKQRIQEVSKEKEEAEAQAVRTHSAMQSALKVAQEDKQRALTGQAR